MKKILTTAGVSVLSTLAAVGGVVGVLANAPSTKDKFSVSWSQTDLIGKNQENISNLEKEIAEKDNQIQGQQVTIQELQDMLAGPKETHIPEELSNLTSVNVLKTSTKYSIVSSNDASVLGIWLLDKTTGQFDKISSEHAGISSVFNYKTDKFIALSSLKVNDKYVLLSIDVNAKSVQVLSEETSNLPVQYATPNNKYILFTSTGGRKIICFNTETEEKVEFNTVVNVADLHVLNDEYVVFYSGKRLLDLTTGSITEIASAPSSKLFVFSGDLYGVDTTGFYKFNIDTLSYDLVSDTLTYASEWFELSDNVLIVKNNSSKAFIYFKDTNDVVNTGKTYSSSCLLKNGNVAIFYNTYMYEYVLETDEFIQKSFNYLTLKELPNGDIVSFTESKLYVYKYLEETNNYEHLSFDISINFEEFEDLGEGKYKLINKNSNVNYLYDSVSKTVTVYSLVIE